MYRLHPCPAAGERATARRAAQSPSDIGTDSPLSMPAWYSARSCLAASSSRRISSRTYSLALPYRPERRRSSTTSRKASVSETFMVGVLVRMRTFSANGKVCQPTAIPRGKVRHFCTQTEPTVARLLRIQEGRTFRCGTGAAVPRRFEWNLTWPAKSAVPARSHRVAGSRLAACGHPKGLALTRPHGAHAGRRLDGRGIGHPA